MVIKKILVFLILLSLFISPLIASETLTDTSSQSLNVQNQNQPQNQVQPQTINQESCLQTYLKMPLFQNMLGFALLLVIIEIIFKGFAMWRAVKRDSKIWFIILLVLSTAGIIPIIYLIITRKKKKSQK